MAEARVVLELTGEEVALVLHWAERATRPMYLTGNRYLSEAEAELLAKLEAADTSGDETES